MSIQFLDEGGSGKIGNGQLYVQLTIHSGGAARVDLVADGEMEPATHRLDQMRVIVAGVPTRTLIRATSQGAHFPDGTTLQISISLRAGTGSGSSQIVGPKIDVSARSSVDVARVEPTADGSLSVTALSGGPRADLLTPVARAAQFAALRLREDGQFAHLTGGFVLCLDRSASMLPHARSGVMQVIAEAVLGVDRGLGDAGVVPVYALGQGLARLPDLSDANAPNYLTDNQEALRPTTGFESRCLGDIPLAHGDERLVIVTDDLPPSGAVGQRESWQFLLIGDSTASLAAGVSGFSYALIDRSITAQDVTVGPSCADRARGLVEAILGADHTFRGGFR